VRIDLGDGDGQITTSPGLNILAQQGNQGIGFTGVGA
jgi:hypothetical protein